ncbi:MAG: hypothetical protein ABFD98_03100 [Syntrophobacteraceae bacterium]|nr:hypothetical protein [Desulfobacteraceae bacterium]
MKVILYASNTMAGQITDIIRTAVPEAEINAFDSIGGLTDGLHRLTPFNGKTDTTVAVLFAANQQELLNFHSLTGWLWNVRIILVLPDRTRETISIGLKLKPRFFTFADGDFGEIGAILAKIAMGSSIPAFAH